MKSSSYIDLQRFMLIPTKFPLTRDDSRADESIGKTCACQQGDKHPASKLGKIITPL